MKQGSVTLRKSRLKKAREMWHFLKTQEAFHRAPVLTLFRLATWYWRCQFRVAMILDLPRWNMRMSVPAHRRGFGKVFYAFRDYYEPELAYLEKVLWPGNVFVDVGANFGVYTLAASKLVSAAGKVIAIEPTAQSFAILQQNIALNNSANVRAFQIALTQTKGKAWLYHGWDPVGNSLGRDPLCADGGEEVQTESLDNLLEENGIGRVDVRRDGTGRGPNLETTAVLADRAGLPIIASGGIASVDDLARLAAIPGVAGAIVGRALYTGAIDLTAALAAMAA